MSESEARGRGERRGTNDLLKRQSTGACREEQGRRAGGAREGHLPDSGEGMVLMGRTAQGNARSPSTVVWPIREQRSAQWT